MYKIFISFLLGLVLFIGCADDPTPSLYDPNAHQAANNDVPEIISIAPAGSSYAGVGNLILTGSNFNPVEPVNVTNQVSFRRGSENTVAEILTVTENEMTILSPVLVADSIEVKVWSSGADPYSDVYYYKLKAAVSELAVVDAKQAEANYHSVDVSADGRVLIAVENLSSESVKGVIKITDAGGNVDTTYAMSAQVVEGIKFDSDPDRLELTERLIQCQRNGCRLL